MTLARPVEDGVAIVDVASGPALEEAQASLATFVAEGYRVTGSRSISDVTLQQRVDLDGSEEVRIYVCESVANLELLDRNGASLVSPDRPDLTAFEVAVVISIEESLVNERIVWTGDGLCSA